MSIHQFLDILKALIPWLLCYHFKFCEGNQWIQIFSNCDTSRWQHVVFSLYNDEQELDCIFAEEPVSQITKKNQLSLSFSDSGILIQNRKRQTSSSVKLKQANVGSSLSFWSSCWAKFKKQSIFYPDKTSAIFRPRDVDQTNLWVFKGLGWQLFVKIARVRISFWRVQLNTLENTALLLLQNAKVVEHRSREKTKCSISRQMGIDCRSSDFRFSQILI